MGDTAVLDGSEVEITELEKIEADRVDGVGSPANGIPFLLLKSLPEPAAEADGDGTEDDSPGGDGDGSAEKSARDILVKAVTDGKIDQAPDIDLGHQIMDLLSQAIIGEAQEIGAGSYGETCDVDLLNCAASMISRWVGREAAPGDDDDMGMLMASAAVKAAESAKTQNDLPDSAFAYIEPGGEKDEDGKTTPRSKRHFPVHDKAHADNAAARIAQGAEFGDKAKAKVTAAQKKFGSNSDDTSKSAVAEGETSVDTEAQGNDSQFAKAAEALAKVEALEGRITAAEERAAKAEEQVAKFAAMPREGGPLMSVTRLNGARGDENQAAKARYYREMADTVADPGTADHYRQLAAQAEATA